ncbi:CDP-glycerol:glycerophosphate glycerophosphotransferase, partial [Streptomyces sp. WAC02707]
EALTNAGRLTSPLAEVDGQVYWCDRHLDTEQGRQVLDVTARGFHTRPLTTLALGNRLTSYESTDGVVRLAGRVVNPLGRIAPDAKLGAVLEFSARRSVGGKAARIPVTSVRHAGEWIEWEGTADVARTVRPLGIIDAVWDVRLILTVDGQELRTRVSVGGTPLDNARSLKVRPRLTTLVSDRFVPEITKKGNLSYVLSAEGRAAVHTSSMIEGAMHGRTAQLAKTSLRRLLKAKKDLNSGETKLRVYHEFYSKLPIRKGLVVFESHLGKQYSDSPRAIYEEMRRQGVRFEAVWSYEGAKPTGFPQDATLVKRWSWQYLRALAQAEFWIDNQGFPLRLAKRPGTTYIQTWH